MGDPIRELEELARLFGALNIETVAEHAAPKVEAVATTSIIFGETPDGQRWPPRKDGQTPTSPHLASLTSVRAEGAALVVTVDHPAAEFLQRGTKNRDGEARMARRQLLPDDGRDLPQLWSDAIAAGLAEAVPRGDK